VPLGIYISVPFCRTKCSYCNFASDVFSKAVFGRYVDRLCSDIDHAASIAQQMGGAFESEVDSIYLGGGTPTVLDPAQLQRTFNAIRRTFSVQSEAEITVECAPGTLTPVVVETLLRCGVNRVSLGVQSFVDQEAAAVGRLHKRSTVISEIQLLRESGIENINVDLIAGLPHQTAHSWQFSLDTLLGTGVPHASVYMLEIDEDSRLGRELIAGGTKYHAHFVPDENLTADFYEAACEFLNNAGIAQYEISNFARPRCESHHNLKYWTRHPYLGFGVDAHSMLNAALELSTLNPHTEDLLANSNGKNSLPEADTQNSLLRKSLPNAQNPPRISDGASSPNSDTNSDKRLDAVRFSTSDQLEAYVAGAPVTRTEVSRLAALEEEFFLRLRLNAGLNLESLRQRYGEADCGRSGLLEDVLAAMSDAISAGLLERDDQRLRLTSRGRLLSNEVFAAVLASRAET
jgi:oxygen-independent coproporphyrinogen III oxidase